MTKSYWWIVTLAVCVFVLVSQKNAEDKPEKVLRHVVLFQFKEDAPAENIKTIEDGFRALPGKIKEITDFEWGTNIGGKERSQGYTHCFIVTFAGTEGLEKYLPHPAHQAFVELLKPTLEKALVIDYWSGK